MRFPTSSLTLLFPISDWFPVQRAVIFFKYFQSLARLEFSRIFSGRRSCHYRGGSATAVGQRQTEIGSQLGEGNCQRKDIRWAERGRHRFTEAARSSSFVLRPGISALRGCVARVAPDSDSNNVLAAPHGSRARNYLNCKTASGQ